MFENKMKWGNKQKVWLFRPVEHRANCHRR